MPGLWDGLLGPSTGDEKRDIRDLAVAAPTTPRKRYGLFDTAMTPERGSLPDIQATADRPTGGLADVLTAGVRRAQAADAEAGRGPGIARDMRNEALREAVGRSEAAEGALKDAAASPLLFALGGAGTAGHLTQSVGTLTGIDPLEEMGRNLREGAVESKEIVGSTGLANVPYVGGAIAANIIPYAGAARLAPWAAKGGAAAIGGRALTSAPVDAVQAAEEEGNLPSMLAEGARAVGLDRAGDVLDKAGESFAGRFVTEVATNVIPDAALEFALPAAKRAASAMADQNTRILGDETGAINLGGARSEVVVPPNADRDLVLKTIATGERKTKARDAILSAPERAYTTLVDATYPIKAAGKRVGRNDVSDVIVQNQGWEGMADQHLADELAPVLGKLKDDTVYEDAMVLAKVRRDLDLRTRGVAEKTDIPDDVLIREMERLEANPEVVEAADGLTGYYRKLLEMKRDAGVLSDEAYEEIVKSEDFYTPFLREWDDAAQVVSPGSGSLAQRGTGVRRMDKDAVARAKTQDPFEVAILDTRETFRRVAKQKVTNVVADIVAENPDALAGVAREVPVGTQSKTGRVVEVTVNGERKAMEILDQDFYNAFASFDPMTSNIFTKVLGGFKRALQTGVTILPDFAVANALRDNTQVAVQHGNILRDVLKGSGVGAAVGAATSEDRLAGAAQGAMFGAGGGVLLPQALRSLQGIAEIAGNKEVYQQFLREGGATQGFYGNRLSPQEIAREMRGLKPSILNPKTWWHTLQSIGNAAEMGPRLARYKSMVAEGSTPQQAAAGARDVSLNFAQVGAGTRGVAASTAFWNPKVQGWDKLVRMVKDPKTAAAGVAAMTAPTIALWNINKDNPEYWERPLWERNGFWLIPKEEGGFWRMPKPFELGFLFASLPERFLDYQYQRGQGEDAAPTETFKEGMKDMAVSTAEGIVPIPNAIRPVVEQGANFDFFRQRPIVSNENLAPRDQYDDRTSSTMRALGDLIGISPQRMEHFVRSSTGGGGGLVLDLADRTTRAVGGDDRAAPLDTGLPVVGPLTKRFSTRDGGLTEPELALRRRAQKGQEARSGLRKRERENPESADEYVQENAEILDAADPLIAMNNALRKLADERRAIAQDKSLKPTEKRALLKEIDEERRLLAAEGLRLPITTKRN